MAPEIWFPHLGITIEHLSRECFRIGSFPVYWYGIIITLSILCGARYAIAAAKSEGLNAEIIQDFLFVGMIASIIGARLYYVVFSWDSYKDNLFKVFALREGGLAVYGGIIGGLIALALFTKSRKLKASSFMDIIFPGFILGQAIGRWGNFFNREAFGGYTENIFAMRYLEETVAYIPWQLKDKILIVNSARYIQVHPTFLYESLWNLTVFAFLILYRSKKKFDGELTAFYFLLYGIGRFWIEGLRCDQLTFGSTGIAVSQVLSAIVAALSLIFIIYKRRKMLIA